ncbi:MAG: hydantoinase/oxoprolinase family protein [Gammaproteobacteria bacterium]|nr:hydantoinase/oxoprolinase family protein [Gammaproteobacteria bacterium]
MKKLCRIGVDIGGTFTDIVIKNGEHIRHIKILTRDLEQSLALTKALEVIAPQTAPAEFLHSTTLVTNMLLEHKGAKTGFITTQGMRDLLYIARHKRPLNYAIRQNIPWQHNAPVPRKWRITIPERVDANGKVLVALDKVALIKAVKKLVADGVESIAIGFLHAYSFPQHEQLAKKIIRKQYANLPITLSSDVSARFREYERFITAALNARVLPHTFAYLQKLSAKIYNIWPKLKLTVMTNTGGLETVDFASANSGAVQNVPIKLALSGLAAAGNAFKAIAKKLSLPNCIGIDVGGTSTDVIVIKNYKLNEAPLEQRSVAGFPLQIPLLDLHTLGAGGGSIISRDEFGELRVGPLSAGANPGPACYGFGGKEPTLTDAALLVGRMPRDLKLAGSIPINILLAQKVFAKKFHQKRYIDIVKIALDALLLAEANIAFAMREQTIARGLNPQEMALIAAGGAGGMLACGIADILELSKVIIPVNPGLLAAWGLLVAPHTQESTITILKNLNTLNDFEIKKYFAKARAKLASFKAKTQLHYIAALRYLGQGFEVEIELAGKIPSLAKLKIAFHAAHKKEYGFALEATDIEWIELSARRVKLSNISVENFSAAQSYYSSANKNNLVIWDYAKNLSQIKKISAKMFYRSDLPRGFKAAGPLVITEQSATTYVPCGWQLKVVEHGVLILSRRSSKK